MTGAAAIPDVDKVIQTIKDNHPALASLEEAKDSKSTIEKVKALDPKEGAVKTLAALHALQALVEVQRRSISTIIVPVTSSL